MAKTYTNVYIENLQRQITHAAQKLKQQRKAKHISDFVPEDHQPTYVLSKVEVQQYRLMTTEASFMLLGQYEPTDNNYAAGAYKSTDKNEHKSTVIEGLVFKNNREFDFKV